MEESIYYNLCSDILEIIFVQEDKMKRINKLNYISFKNGAKIKIYKNDYILLIDIIPNNDKYKFISDINNLKQTNYQYIKTNNFTLTYTLNNHKINHIEYGVDKIDIKDYIINSKNIDGSNTILKNYIFIKNKNKINIKIPYNDKLLYNCYITHYYNEYNSIFLTGIINNETVLNTNKIIPIILDLNNYLNLYNSELYNNMIENKDIEYSESSTESEDYNEEETNSDTE